jgi:uncharacterized integral membrane protein
VCVGFFAVINSSKYIAAIFGLTGFVVAAVAGLVAGNPSETVLSRAIIAMFACYLCGLPLGAAAVWAIEQYIKSFKKPTASPTSGGNAASSASSAEAGASASEEPFMTV